MLSLGLDSKAVFIYFWKLIDTSFTDKAILKTLSSYSTVRGSFKRGLKRFESAKSLWSVNPIFDKACVRINWDFDV